jgi:hypothetical protein
MPRLCFVRDVHYIRRGDFIPVFEDQPTTIIAYRSAIATTETLFMQYILMLQHTSATDYMTDCSYAMPCCAVDTNY